MSGSSATINAKMRAEGERNARLRMIEGIFMAVFLSDLLIRLGTPDLWNPAKVRAPNGL